MAINYPDIPLLSPQQMGMPDTTKAVGAGTSVVDAMIKAKLDQLDAAKRKAQLPYAAQDLLSTIGLRQAQAQQAQQEAAKTQYQMDRGLLYPETLQLMQAGGQSVPGFPSGNQSPSYIHPQTRTSYRTNYQPSANYDQSSQADDDSQTDESTDMDSQNASSQNATGISSANNRINLPTADDLTLDQKIYWGDTPSIGIETGNPYLDAKLNQSKSPRTEVQLKRAEADIDMQNKLYQDDIEKAKQNAENANTGLVRADQFLDAYNRIKLAKGSIFGNTPALSSAAKDVDAISQQIVNNSASRWQSKGHITDNDLKFMDRAKGQSRDMPEESALRFNSISKGASIREIEKQQAVNYAKAHNIRNEIMDQAFNLYQRQRPASNQEPGQYYMNNGYLNTWKDYFTPQALRAMVKNGTYTPSNNKELREQNIKSSEIKNAAQRLGMNQVKFVQMIEHPNLIPAKDLKKIPKNILREMGKHAQAGN